MIIDVLGLCDFFHEEIHETLDNPTEILENILDFAVSKGLIENTVTERDLFDTRVMNCVMPRPSEVRAKFNSLYDKLTELFL